MPYTPKGYTDKTAVENYLLININESFDNQIGDWIAAIERYIEKFTGRIFVASEEPTIKTFSGNGEDILYIPDALEITELTIDDEVVDVDDYFYESNEEDLPITQIKMKYGVFNEDYSNIKVEARWGYSEEVPPDIKYAATVLVGGIVNNGANSGGEVQSETIGRYTVSYSTPQQKTDFENVKAILKSYRRMTI